MIINVVIQCTYSAAEEAFTCIEGKTQMSCGDAAKEFVHHYLEATIQPLMKGVTCNHSKSKHLFLCLTESVLS